MVTSFGSHAYLDRYPLIWIITAAIHFTSIPMPCMPQRAVCSNGKITWLTKNTHDIQTKLTGRLVKSDIFCHVSPMLNRNLLHLSSSPNFIGMLFEKNTICLSEKKEFKHGIINRCYFKPHTQNPATGNRRRNLNCMKLSRAILEIRCTQGSPCEQAALQTDPRWEGLSQIQHSALIGPKAYVTLITRRRFASINTRKNQRKDSQNVKC